MKRLLILVALLVVGGNAAFAQWEVSSSIDEISGEKSCYAFSPSFGPTEQMGFPYSDVVSWIGVGINKDSEWAYFGFSTNPNLTGGKIGDGYKAFKIRGRWDDKQVTLDLTQKWGSKFLHVMDDRFFIRNLLTRKLLIIELDWYNEGNVYFKYDLSGAKEAIEKARAMCRGD